MKTLASFASVVCLLLYAIGVSAHHSFVTHYDYDKEITVTGAMTEIRIASPHSLGEWGSRRVFGILRGSGKG